MTPFRLSLVALVTTLTAAGCANGNGVKTTTGDHGTTSSSTGTGTGGSKTEACVPGMQIECACVGGGLGVQVCAPDGSSYGTCYGCDSGTGGSGGTTATSSSSTSTSSSSTSSSTTTSSSTSGMMGPPCAAGPIDLGQVTIYSNPPDLATWPVTTMLTEVDFTNDGLHLVFDKQDGANRWPDVIPPGWMGPLQYTIGMVECINGQWYTSAVIEVWYGLYAAGGNVAMNNQIAMNWYYDSNRWGLLAGRQPATGEMVGVFVAAGNLRNITSDDPAQSPVMERSNVVLVPFPDVNGAMHSF